MCFVICLCRFWLLEAWGSWDWECLAGASDGFHFNIFVNICAFVTNAHSHLLIHHDRNISGCGSVNLKIGHCNCNCNKSTPCLRLVVFFVHGTEECHIWWNKIWQREKQIFPHSQNVKYKTLFSNQEQRICGKFKNAASGKKNGSQSEKHNWKVLLFSGNFPVHRIFSRKMWSKSEWNFKWFFGGKVPKWKWNWSRKKCWDFYL